MSQYGKIIRWSATAVGVGVLLLVVNTIQTALPKLSPKTFAQTSAQSVTGALWSDNIGWVDLSGVTFDHDMFSGVGWSNSIGWVSFYPTDVSTCFGSDVSIDGQRAQIRSSDNRLVGWARVLSEKGRNGEVDPKINDGWDGCIDLSGTSKGEASIFNPTSGNLSAGNVWGQDVFGWGKLSDVRVSSAITYCADGSQPPCTVTSCEAGQILQDGVCVPDSNPNPNPNPNPTELFTCSATPSSAVVGTVVTWSAFDTAGAPVVVYWGSSGTAASSKVVQYSTVGSKSIRAYNPDTRQSVQCTPIIIKNTPVTREQ